MTAPRRDLRLMQQQASELDARLAATRYTARSADQLVTAVATGQGALLDLRIDDRALAGAHTHKLGLSIVEAVRAARAAANAAALPQLNALFDKQPPPSPPSQPLLAEPPSGSGPAAAPRPAVAPEPVRHRATPVDDESFEELDFLTDEEPRGGGRW